MDIHVTEAVSFRNCRRQWRYSYKEGLEPKEKSYGALWLGQAVHFALARFYLNKEKNLVKTFDEWANDSRSPLMTSTQLQNWEDNVALGRSILDRYERFATTHDDWEVVSLEKPLRALLPYSLDLFLVGTPDLIVRRGDGRLWIIDHKTFASFVDESDIELDDQLTSYLWLVKECFHEEPAGAIYNQMRKKIPSQPYILKSGGISKARNQDSTPDVFLAAISDLGLDPVDYEDVLSDLAKVEWFRRTPMKRTSREMDMFAAEVTEVARQIALGHEYPNRSTYCKWGCSYRTLCRLESIGADVEEYRERMFDSVKDKEVVRF